MLGHCPLRFSSPAGSLHEVVCFNTYACLIGYILSFPPIWNLVVEVW